jgi:hypothetical protein
MACAYITDLAKGIHQEIGQPTSISVSFIQSKLISKSFLGQLNTLLYKNHTIENGDIVTELDTQEQAIYSRLWIYEYYNSQGPVLLASMAAGNYWTNVKEGDSSITRANPVEIAKYFKTLAAQYKAYVDEMVEFYNKAQSFPRSNDMYTINVYGNYAINGSFSSYRPGNF